MSDSLQPHELQHTSLPWSSLSPGVCSNSCPLSDAIQPSHPLGILEPTLCQYIQQHRIPLKFPKRHKLSKLAQEGIYNLNSLLFIKKWNLCLKKKSHKENYRSRWPQWWILPNILERVFTQFYTNFSRKYKRRQFFQLILWGQHYLDTQMREKNLKTESDKNYKSIILDIKRLNI